MFFAVLKAFLRFFGGLQAVERLGLDLRRLRGEGPAGLRHRVAALDDHLDRLLRVPRA